MDLRTPALSSPWLIISCLASGSLPTSQGCSQSLPHVSRPPGPGGTSVTTPGGHHCTEPSGAEDWPQGIQTWAPWSVLSPKLGKCGLLSPWGSLHTCPSRSQSSWGRGPTGRQRGLRAPHEGGGGGQGCQQGGSGWGSPDGGLRVPPWAWLELQGPVRWPLVSPNLLRWLRLQLRLSWAGNPSCLQAPFPSQLWALGRWGASHPAPRSGLGFGRLSRDGVSVPVCSLCSLEKGLDPGSLGFLLCKMGVGLPAPTQLRRGQRPTGS